MFTDRASHRPSGSLADLSTKPVNRIRAHCQMCGCGLNKVKRFCLPCYDIRLESRRHAKKDLVHEGGA
jgi:hypothetical protein